MKTVNMMDPNLLADPFGGFAALREEAPVLRASFPWLDDDTPIWLVTRYDDVRTVLSDHRFVNDPRNVPGGTVDNARTKIAQARGVPPEYADFLANGMLDLDGDDHLRLRRLVSRAFTARRVMELRPRVEEISARLLDALPSDRVVDLVEEYAYPLPITVICELVGIPEADRPQWRAWGARMVSMEPGALAEPLVGIIEYVQGLIPRRRATPADDLLTGLIRAHDEDGDRLSDAELVTMVLTLVLAGHETTAHLIGNGTAALLTHPDQLARLRAEPELMPRAVHELMRWCGPVHGTRLRYPVEDVALDGAVLRRGEPVMAVLVSANFDPRRFDDADRLDIARESDSRREVHVGFGHGLHYCLGAALARQEGEVAFGGLLSRFPGLRLAVPPEKLERQLMPGSWRLAALPVLLDG
ncbi:cytochrome P450 [Nonomuraea sp. NPDC003804]|uniref:cytochrome P450 family protein n=1 Tax=Nonomuraea sp. NPDC003804 TaxID=3154547 RepID=UPI0033A5ADA1